MQSLWDVEAASHSFLILGNIYLSIKEAGYVGEKKQSESWLNTTDASYIALATWLWWQRATAWVLFSYTGHISDRPGRCWHDYKTQADLTLNSLPQQSFPKETTWAICSLLRAERSDKSESPRRAQNSSGGFGEAHLRPGARPCKHNSLQHFERITFSEHRLKKARKWRPLSRVKTSNVSKGFYFKE